MTDTDRQGPVDPSSAPTAHGELTVPQQVMRARWLWIASAVVGLVSAFVQLANRTPIINRIQQNSPELSQSEVDAAANATIMFSLMVAAAVALLYYFLSNWMVRGRNWARIAIIVIGGLNAFGTAMMLLLVSTQGTTLTLPGMSVHLGALDIVFALITAALDIAVLVLVLRPESNHFFREATARYRAQRANRFTGTGGFGSGGSNGSGWGGFGGFGKRR